MWYATPDWPKAPLINSIGADDRAARIAVKKAQLTRREGAFVASFQERERFSGLWSTTP